MLPTPYFRILLAAVAFLETGLQRLELLLCLNIERADVVRFR